MLGAALLYVAVGVALLFAGHRFLTPISRAAALVLLLLPFLLTGRALLRGEVYAPVDIAFQTPPLKPLAPDLNIRNPALSDIYAQILPWHQAVRFAYQAGEWPLWNPFLFAGDILAAAAQPAPYYPFNIVALLLPLDLAITFLATITLFNAAFGAFVLIRDLGCSEEAALIGASIWMLSSFLVFWNEWPLGVSVSLLPFIVFATRRVVVRADLSSVVLLVFMLALLVLAGHPESALHVVAAACIYGLYELVTSFLRAREERCAARFRHVGMVMWRAIAAGAIAFGLTAFFVLPILEALPQTREHEVRQLIGRRFSLARPWPAALRDVARSFVPFLDGLPQDPKPGRAAEELPRSYAGSLAFGLALIGILFSKHRERWLLLAFVLLGWLAGARAPFPTYFLEELPLFRITFNDRLIIVATFGIAVLAAFGAERVAESRSPKRSALIFLVVGAGLGAAVMLTWPSLTTVLTPPTLLRHALLLIVPCAVAAAVLTFTRGRTAVVLLLTLLLVQRAGEEHGVYPTLQRLLFFPPIPEFQGLARDGSLYRVVSQQYTFIPNVSALYRLEDVRGYQAMTHAGWFATYPLWCRHQPQFYNRVDDLTRPFLSLLNVRFALMPRDQPVAEGWRVISEGQTMRLLENMRVLPRAFVPRLIRLGTSPDDLEDMAEERDFGERSWIAAWRRGKPRLVREEANGAGRVTILRQGLGFVLAAEMKQSGWIVISETAWKGWRAYVDRQRVPVFIANHALLAVHAPAGNHTIELRYLPDSFVLGRRIFAVTVLLLLTGGVFRRIQLRRAR